MRRSHRRGSYSKERSPRLQAHKPGVPPFGNETWRKRWRISVCNIFFPQTLTVPVEDEETEFMNHAALNWITHSRNAQINGLGLLLPSAWALYDTSCWRLRIWFSRYWGKCTHLDPSTSGLHYPTLCCDDRPYSESHKKLGNRHEVNIVRYMNLPTIVTTCLGVSNACSMPVSFQLV